MLRGCQKKIVFLKNTGSKIFDEAYFVISDKTLNDEICDTDMISEANRIIEECIGNIDGSSEKGAFSRAISSLRRALLPFMIGALVMGGMIITFALLT